MSSIWFFILLPSSFILLFALFLYWQLIIAEGAFDGIVLDVATGTGRLPIALRQFSPFQGQVIGLDSLSGAGHRSGSLAQNDDCRPPIAAGPAADRRRCYAPALCQQRHPRRYLPGSPGISARSKKRTTRIHARPGPQRHLVHHQSRWLGNQIYARQNVGKRRTTRHSARNAAKRYYHLPLAQYLQSGLGQKKTVKTVTKLVAKETELCYTFQTFANISKLIRRPT